MVFIYVLRLKNDKYYVGKTENPKFRIDTHFKNGGCYWTKKYKPCQIIGLFPDCDAFDEDKYTLKYMEKKGIDNVRGGSFSQIKLSEEQLKLISQMITGANNTPENIIKQQYQSEINTILEDINMENIIII